MNDLIDHVETERTGSLTFKEQIEKPGGKKTIGEFALALAKHYRELENPILFYNVAQREVVRLGMVAMDKKNGKNEKTLGFIIVQQADFITKLEADFDIGSWVKVKDPQTKEEDWVFEARNISKDQANTVLKSVDQFRENLPIVQNLYPVQMPMIKDGKLCLLKKGYDIEMFSWVPENAPSIRTDMTLEEAKGIIDKIYSEFCFNGEQDRINAKAALLTPFCRLIYSRLTARTPLFFYMGNRERAGKDYCAGITGITYEGTAVEDTPISTEGDDHGEELRKKILANLKIGRTRIHSSNNKGFINNAQFESTITSENIIDRPLGSSTMLQFPNTLEFSLSANIGITYSADLAQRSVFINFFFAQEDPNARTFTTPNLHKNVMEHRDDILSALYVLVRNWHEKGMPSGSRPFASFPEWARVVGGIMEAAGYGFPVGNDVLNAVGGDKETADMKRFFKICFDNWKVKDIGGNEKTTWITKQALYAEFFKAEGLFVGLFSWLDWEKVSARTRFALLLGKFKGRILDSIMMEVLEESNATRNTYRFVGGVGVVGVSGIEKTKREVSSIDSSKGWETTTRATRPTTPPILSSNSQDFLEYDDPNSFHNALNGLVQMWAQEPADILTSDAYSTAIRNKLSVPGDPLQAHSTGEPKEASKGFSSITQAEQQPAISIDNALLQSDAVDKPLSNIASHAPSSTGAAVNTDRAGSSSNQPAFIRDSKELPNSSGVEDSTPNDTPLRKRDLDLFKTLFKSWAVGTVKSGRELIRFAGESGFTEHEVISGIQRLKDYGDVSEPRPNEFRLLSEPAIQDDN